MRIPHEQLDEHPEGSAFCTLRGEPFTGVAYSTWPDGSVRREWSFRNGEKWGPQRQWHSNGRLTISGYCVAGFAHGVYRYRTPEGRKISVKLIQFGIEVRSRSWDAGGNVRRDYRVEDERQAHWYLREIEEGRRKYGNLVAAEAIPGEFLVATEEDWQ
jgi:antitoxin component YwqK of YwqJK toxin-antitoxin module